MTRWLALCALAVLGAPVFAETVEGRGYFTGCLSDSCEIVWQNKFLYAEGGQGTPTDLILQLYEADRGVQAVDFMGETTEFGDGSAALVLHSFAFVGDDPIALALDAVQGRWRPMGAATQDYIRIRGVRWEETTPGQAGRTWQILPGTACSDGASPGGTLISLTPTLSAPARAGCWQIETVDEFEMVLRDVTKDMPPMRYVFIGD